MEQPPFGVAGPDQDRSQPKEGAMDSGGSYAPLQMASLQIAAEDPGVCSPGSFEAHATPTAEDSFQTQLLDLPDEVLLPVLCSLATEDLVSVGGVCTRLRCISKDVRIWQNRSLVFERDEFNFCRVLRAAPCLSMVDVWYLPGEMHSMTRDALLQSPCVVRGLIVKRHKRDLAFDVALLRRHQGTVEHADVYAKEEDISYSDGKEYRPGTSAILDAIDGMPRLKRLTLRCRLGYASFTFGRHSNTLEWLDLRWYECYQTAPLESLLSAHRHSLRSVALQTWVDSSVLEAVESFSNLEELQVNVSKWSWGIDEFPVLRTLTLFRNGPISDKLRDRTPRLPRLEELHLNAMDLVNDLPRSVQDVLGQLKALSVEQTYNIVDSVLTYLLRQTPNLERLSFLYGTILRPDLLVSLRKLVPRLKKMDLSAAGWRSWTECRKELPKLLNEQWPGISVVGNVCRCETCFPRH